MWCEFTSHWNLLPYSDYILMGGQNTLKIQITYMLEDAIKLLFY